MSIVVRLATEADAELLARLNRAVHDLHVAAEPERYRRPQASEVQAWFRIILDACDNRVLIIEQEGEAAGYALVKLVTVPESPFTYGWLAVHVEQLAIEPRFRRRGLGRELMLGVERFARSNRCDAITLDVRSFNSEALAFYRAIGYEHVSFRLRRELEPHARLDVGGE